MTSRQVIQLGFRDSRGHMHPDNVPLRDRVEGRLRRVLYVALNILHG